MLSFKFVPPFLRVRHPSIMRQVWFRDLAFRSGVYQCQPTPDAAHHFEVRLIQTQLSIHFPIVVPSAEFSYLPAPGHIRCITGEYTKCL
jgi:hypothetical protein